jgi:Propeller
MVWALDVEHNVYFREGVRSDFLIGSAWVKVPFTKATQLAIRFVQLYYYVRRGVILVFLSFCSEHSVWALSHSGNVYRRCGITRSNEGGDSWESIPGVFEWITGSSYEIFAFVAPLIIFLFCNTVSIDDVLWAINSEGVVFKLSTTMPDMGPPCLKPNADDFLTSEDDWVLL